MMKLLRYIPLLLLVPFVFAFEVSPKIIEQSVKPGDVKVVQIMVKNTDTNKTHSYLLTISGAVSNYIVLEDNDFELPPQTSKVVKVYLIVPKDTQAGTYDGYIVVDEVDTNVTPKDIYVKLTVNPWVASTTVWIPVPSKLYVDAYSFNVTWTNDKSCLIINSKTLCRDDEQVFYDKVKIRVVDINRDSEKAYLKIETKFENPSITYQALEEKKTGTTTTSAGEVELYPSEITKKIQLGSTSSSIVLYLYNGLNVPIKIERVDVYGDVFEFEDGVTEPVSDIKVPQSRTLEPGDEVPIVVKLSSKRLEPGRYTVTLTVTYRVNNKIKHEYAILDIVVFKSQYQAISELSISMPDKIEANETFTIEVRGVTSNYEVKVKSDRPECLVGQGSVEGEVYKFVGKVTCTGSVTLTVDVYRDNILVKSLSKEYIIKKKEQQQQQPQAPKPLFIRIEPANPQPGDTVRIYAIDSKGNIVSNAIIKVNGIPMSTFIAEPKKTYTIEVEAPGYKKATKVIKVPGYKCKIILEPENPKYGDIVTIIVKDAKTDNIISATIKVNGKVISGNKIKIDKEGTYTIVAENPQYDPCTRSFIVTIPLEVKVNKTTITVGENITAQANKPVYWVVYYRNPKTNVTEQYYVSTTATKVLTVKATKPGEYIIEVGGKRYVITVKERFNVLPWVLGAIIFILLIGIIKKLRGRRRFRPPTTSKEISVEPPSYHTKEIPSFPAIPMSNEEEKEVKEIEKK